METNKFLRLAAFSACLLFMMSTGPASALLSPSAASLNDLTSSGAPLTSLPGEEYNPQVAYSPTSDQYLLAFSYAQPAGEFYVFSIQSLLVDDSGNPLTAPALLSSNDASLRRQPAITYNSQQDSFLVIWDDQYSPEDHDIFARSVSAAGMPIGSEYAVDYTGFDDSLPDMAYNPLSGGYLAVWERWQNGQSEIYATLLDSGGAPVVGSGFYIADDSIDESGASLGVSSTSGAYLALWHQQTAAGNYDIYGQLLNSAGAKVGGLIPISTAAGDQLHPQLAYDEANDQFLVVWQDQRLDSDIYGQRLSGNGALLGGNFPIADQGSNHRKDPQVAYQPNAVDFMVTWSMSAPGENVDIYRRRVRTDGSLPEIELAVSATSSMELYPTLVAGAGISYLFAWQDNRDTAQNENIYGTIVNLNRLQGKVFQGPEGDETTPLEGVLISLYGSNNPGQQGSLLESMLTVPGGWFGLIAPAGYEYYSLIETNLQGFISVAAASPSGSVLDPDWIQFVIPLENQDLAGNRFWDQPEAPLDCGGVFYPGADTSVTQYDPETPHGDAEVLFVEQGVVPGSGQARAFLYFDLADRIPAEAIIHSAELELTLSHPPVPGEFQLGTASLPHAWDEATLTWNDQPPAGYAFETKSYQLVWSDTEPVILRVDVSTLVNLWATGVFTPTSVALMPPGQRLDFNFYSRESHSPPRLLVHCSPRIASQPQAEQELNDRQLEGIARLTSQSSIPPTIQLGESGAVRFALFDLTAPDHLSSALSRAIWFTEVYADLLRLEDPSNDLQFVRRSDDEADLFFRQRYQGIPVLGSEIGIHLFGKHITGVSGSYLSDLHLYPTPHISAERARQIALALGAPGASVISEDQLRLLSRSLFYDDTPRTYLTWMVVLDQGGGEEIYIDASTGALRFQQPRSLEGFDLDIETVNHNSGAGTYCHHYWWTTDDDHWCDEDGCNSDATQEGINAYNYIKNVYDYWKTYLGRDSFDDDGDDIQFYLNVGTNWDNARWLGGCDFFEFGDGNAVLDIVGHEFSHGVTDYTSDLVYMNESGALDESFADINGAFVDYGDWLIGEDSPGGASRSLADPTLYGDPDRYNSPDKVQGTTWDYGGVHVNSGIHNKAAYLITNGGSFNGVNIPSGGIGLWRARVLFYKTLKRLTSNASMLDARDAALASALEMAQQNTNGFTANHVCIVRNGYHAVELGDGDLDCDGTEDNQDTDQDGDKVPNLQDNCSTTSNPDQANTDKDSQGDACDTDDDNDGDLDTADNCPLVSNPNQEDTNSDGAGDACDDNDDNDLIPDALDNCPLLTNHDQLDTDSDGFGDVCDDNDDNDTVVDYWDNCPLVVNNNQANSDGDPFGDACDLCPNFPGTDNADPDKDGMGNSCDTDDDNDGLLDGADNCPVNYNPEQHDVDGDGKGWACDYDDAAALLRQLKILTLQYNRDSPIRFPLPGCGMCGPGYIDPLYRQQISLVSQAGFYARIVDSTGRVVDRTRYGAGGLLSQVLKYQPAPYAFSSQSIPQTAVQAETGGLFLAPDDVRYFLELFPAENVNLNQTYTMSILVEEYVIQNIYLPLVSR